ncbi:MAG: alpha/beta fold hydrolase [Dermatophilaceae bacterium]
MAAPGPSAPDQEIRFEPVTGGRLAVASLGDGPPLVLPGAWISHVELEWEFPEYRRFLLRLADRHTVIRYDRLGVGLSDPDPAGPRPDLTSEARRLAELLDRLGRDDVSVFGVSWGGCVALTYAAQRPGALRALALHGVPVRGVDIAPQGLRDSVTATVRAHWGAGSRLLADIWVPGADADLRARFTRLQRAAAGTEAAAAALEALYSVDLAALLGLITVPVLVTHRRHDRAVPFAAARDLAAGIPGARLVPLEGDVHPPWLGDAEAMLRALRGFLPGQPPEPPEDAVGPAAALLSQREREVLSLVADGLSDEQIAARLVVSPHTVHRHVANIRTKLGQPSRAAAVAYAGRHGLI